MASQSSEITILTFTPDNPSNTTITAPNGDVLYTVSTEHGKHSVTSVHDKQGVVIATLEWHDNLSDKVAIRDGPKVSYSDWMKKSHIPFKEFVNLIESNMYDNSNYVQYLSELSFKDDQDRKYKWKGLGPSRSIEVCYPMSSQ